MLTAVNFVCKLQRGPQIMQTFGTRHVSSERLRFLFLVSSLFFFYFGSVLQIKLATRQLLGAR